ncbi:nodulation protein Z [Azorhizobium caulinodans ORS 571]|uniref:Nodulation protein Z n=1 Tax=Azorhizobium caulinodans (strain ATCC 43989 / DSM 5975 / JCM 20966 / LMG 6465 / NBRC 14845 / NCIMB 13405 / ORS 571) TaxID=438753 RepID=NODZ_AZOC5|nr:nodulation protein NodZ [Azorhizobium caulinodans]Q43966.1 RecName: Full=Nodulation protein Z [Azorhizobium caulinodans ORS 571]AAB51169.1 fucosyltransferase [Azorhizobium caulinodans ORS 571]BAF89809.1 nodulation protein Z [Azorhizobium caulinodans ORS 571]
MYNSACPEGRSVISRRRTGLGDCLWSLAAAWSYARHTRRSLVVDWSESCYSADPNINLFPVLFDNINDIGGVSVHYVSRTSSLALESSVIPAWWRLPVKQRGTRSDAQIFRERDELRNLFFSRRDADAAAVICDCCLMWCCDEDLEREFYDHLIVNQYVRQEVDRVYAERFLGNVVIGVHIRHGNGEDILDHDRYWCEENAAMNLVAHKIREERRKFPFRSTKIFLCTDSPAVSEWFRREMPGLFATEKEFRQRGEGELHSAHFGLGGAVAALVDMQLLSRCDVLIRYPPTSAFSRWPSLLVERVFDFDLARGVFCQADRKAGGASSG